MGDVNSQRKLNHDGSIPLDPSLINVSESYEHAEIETMKLNCPTILWGDSDLTEFSRSILLSVSEDDDFGFAILEIP